MAPQFPMNHKAACGEAATEEAELVQEMQQYFVQAKGHAGGIKFDNAGLWSKIEKRVVSGSRRFPDASRNAENSTEQRNQSRTHGNPNYMLAVNRRGGCIEPRF
jgi:hypothetical protein